MPAPHDMDPPAMTEGERLAKRRYQAFHVFEQMPARLVVNLCCSVMPDHDPMSILHRCHLGPAHAGCHEAPVTLDARSVFFDHTVSWHDPVVELTE